MSDTDRVDSIKPSDHAGRSVRPHYVCRGLLIILIALGHNKIFYHTYYRAYAQLYNFHVECFLVLPFMRSIVRNDNTHRIMARFSEDVRRLYIPLACFMIFYSAVFYAENPKGEIVDPFGAIMRSISAIIMGNSYSAKAATGFELFWFVPVFILLNLVRYIFNASRISIRTLMLLTALLLNATSGVIFNRYADSIPWGIPIVSYLLFPCLLSGILAEIVQTNKIERVTEILSYAAFVVSISISYMFKMSINLSDFKVYNYHNPAYLICTDTVVISASLSVIYLSARIHSVLLDRVGRFSFQIYLIHGILGFAIVSIFSHFTGNRFPLPAIIATLCLTLFGSYVASRRLMKSRLGMWMFALRRKAPQRVRS